MLLVLLVQTPARAAIHDYTGAVPVLLYHGLHPVADQRRDPYSISPEEFERQMGMLAADGFHAISIGQYARFVAGDVAGLPHRPILITFDDGRLDSYLAADPVLARFGMRATIFVITAKADAAAPGYLGWPQLAALAAGGRWDVQEHAHAGHVLIPTGPRGATGPSYANLFYRNGTREKFTAFKRRVSGDIITGRQLLAARVPGFEPLAFAVPYGNYGQDRTNYAPIPGWELGWLKSAFRTILVQDRPAYTLRGQTVGQRYAIHAGTTAAKLEAWLVGALPRSAWTVPAHRPRRPRLRALHVGRRHVTMRVRAPARTKLKADRRRRGRAHRRRVRVGRRGRLRDRHLAPHTRYVYRVFAVDRQGGRSRPLVVRIRTKR